MKFLIYALASSDETLVHLDFVFRCRYITESEYRELSGDYGTLGKKINRYLQAVMKGHLRPQDKKGANNQ